MSLYIVSQVDVVFVGYFPAELIKNKDRLNESGLMDNLGPDNNTFAKLW